MLGKFVGGFCSLPRQLFGSGIPVWKEWVGREEVEKKDLWAELGLHTFIQ